MTDSRSSETTFYDCCKHAVVPTTMDHILDDTINQGKYIHIDYSFTILAFSQILINTYSRGPHYRKPTCLNLDLDVANEDTNEVSHGT